MVTRKTEKGLGRGLDFLGPRSKKKSSRPRPVQAGLPSALPLTELVPGVYQPRTRMDEGALYELAETHQGPGHHAAHSGAPSGGRRVTLASPPPPPPPPPLRNHRGRAAPPRLSPGWAGGSARAGARGAQRGRCGHGADREHPARRHLNPLEEAQGLQRLIREFGLTHEQAAQAVGRSRSAASNLLRLLNLAEPVQTMLMAGDIDMGHARALLARTAPRRSPRATRSRPRSCRCVKPKAWSKRSAPNSTWCRKSPRRKSRAT